MADYINIGHIARTKGYKGEIGLKLRLDDPYLLTEVTSVFLEHNKKHIPYSISKIKITPKGYANIFLVDVDGEEAETLKGRQVYLPRELLEEKEESSVVYNDMIGFLVTDKNHGRLGTVEHILEHTNNTLLSIKGTNGEILIPLIDEFINTIDFGKKTIEVVTPEGLIDLNN